MKFRLHILAGIAVLGSLGTFAYLRSGLLNLPKVPGEITPEDTGLNDLNDLKAIDDAIAIGKANDRSNEALSLAVLGVTEIGHGIDESGIRHLREAVQADPANLVFGNRLRMEILKQKREWLKKSADAGEIALQFPDYLHDEPVRFFRALVKAHPIREVKLQLALAHVDHMLLFPALEIKAPASVESVEILTDILNHAETNEAYYVPALFARGLNYLYRPFNLVWPEKIATPPDAASKDIALCVAVGRKIGAGSNALKAELSLALGDAYAKEGKLSLARSWWQLANNLAGDEKFRERVFLRLKWEDDEAAASLEQTLQRQMENLEHPVSDLRFVWQ